MLQLRQPGTYADIPLIVISSTGEDRKAIHLGADEYIAKPVEGEALIGTARPAHRPPSITKVLLVDDEEVMRYLVRQLLPRSRSVLRAIGTCREGLQCLYDEHPDVVLLDLNLPEMDGYQFLDRVRGDANLVDVPIIVLTSAILDPDKRTLLQRAANILSKSDMSSGTLIDTIDRVVPRAQPAWAR